jgi:DNA-binding response OmpR family regulator
MVTSSSGREDQGDRGGADDFIRKPFSHDELLIRGPSLLRIKRYHDTIKAAAALELTDARGARARTGRGARALRTAARFLSPQLADAIVSSGDDSILRSHRRQVAMFFADLRGWTSFVDAVEPES